MVKQKVVTKERFNYVRNVYAFFSIFFLMGALFTYIGVHEYLRSTRQDSKATGTVESYESHYVSSTSAHYRRGYYAKHAIVSFWVGSQYITFEGEGHHEDRFPYNMGQQIDVTYEENNPYNAHIASEQHLSWFVFMGVPLMLLFGFLIFVFHRAVREYRKTHKQTLTTNI